ncbi:MAG: YitT family protein [Bacteroidales bacterium]|nr:YitT family protein [Bacteroidales bacterium]
MKQYLSKRELKSWAGVILGTIIMCAGYVFFINPYNIVPGGVYGASIVLHNLFPNIQVGTFGYFFDIPLLLLSVWLLGAKLGIKTLVAALSTPVIMNFISWLVYPNEEALMSLDPSLICGGRFDMSNHLMLSVAVGSLVIGVGCGLIVRSGATSGGTDIVGMLLQKYAHIRFSQGIMMADGCVVLFGLIVLSFMSEDGNGLILSLYSLIAIYLISRSISFTLNGRNDSKMVFVISNADLTTLHNYILKDLDRTATLVKSSGLYTGEDKEMLCIVVSYKEVMRLKQVVKQADPQAFVIVTDAYDTYGDGWKSLPDLNELVPE